jgi:CHAT domain-containing protein
MLQQLYPKERYPQGHPHLAISLNNLGLLLQAQGEYGQALDYLQQALQMDRQLYPKQRYPQGHPGLAIDLNNLGTLLEAQGEYGQALDYYQQALQMRQQLYPKERYPQGHPHLAQSLNNLGNLLQAQGEYAKALAYKQQALQMYQLLYPKECYPQGHPDLAGGLNNLGGLLHAQVEHVKALDYLREALAIYRKQLREFANLAAEAEALSLAATLPRARDSFLSVAAHVPGSDASAYQQVWESKAALTRILEWRHLARRAAISPAAQAKWQALIDCRRHLAHVSASPSRDAATRDLEIRELTDRKERLERDLAELLPRMPRREELDDLGPATLAKLLPVHSALVDLLRYTRFEYAPAKRGKQAETRTEHYIAFVLRPGQTARRVELGPADAIDTALDEWRQAIVRGRDGAAAEALRRLVWVPLRKELPDDTRRLYLSPDGQLGRLPWAALPGDRDGTVLLEQYTLVGLARSPARNSERRSRAKQGKGKANFLHDFVPGPLAVVPHAPFLLEQLLHPARPGAGPGGLLAVGGVSYGDDPRPRHGAAYLPGTAEELRQVIALAGPRPVVALDKEEASVGRLLRELPRARYAHLATHGFFDEAAYVQEVKRIQQQFKNWDFGAGPTERVGVRVRSPLGFTGLVLAGANRPPQKDGESGILTGEGLVELPLEDLRLVVLSACETGLGVTRTDSEGVAGLQRAFHVAGVPNVLVSLWRVDDVATLLLMEEFYTRLWDKEQPLPPAEALRQAQLAMLYHPERVLQKREALKAALVKRGASAEELEARGFGKELAGLPEGGKIEGVKRSPALWWAAFVLSGLGS